jgi:uncharacterized protein (DUF4415 family)
MSMTQEDYAVAFEQIRFFSWNEKKRESNLRKHKIDFEDAKAILDGPIFIRRSDRHGEIRYQIFGYVQGREVSVTCTHRGSLCHIISARRDSPSRGKTDWARVDALTDAEIEASIKDDPDWSDDWNWGEAVLVIPPKKKAISIRVDEDVLDYFKHDGDGYQRRINAVLRSYMQQKQAKKPKKRA